jgi:hypothetical protein
MKTLNIIISSFAILIFSGCYTQLLIEDDGPSAANTQPDGTYQGPIVIEIPVPVPIPMPSPGPWPVPLPPPSRPISTTPVATSPIRDSGYQRSGSESTQQNTQASNRLEGAKRGGR